MFSSTTLPRMQGYYAITSSPKAPMERFETIRQAMEVSHAGGARGAASLHSSFLYLTAGSLV